MMQTILAYFLLALVIAAAYPWAAWLLKDRQSISPLLTAVVALALSFGTLSLVMLWEGILSIPFATLGITLPYLLLMLPGIALWWRSRAAPNRANNMRAGLTNLWFAPAPTNVSSAESQRLPLLVLAAISAAILFNAIYWPFHRDDALGIYQPHAQMMYELRGLVPLAGADSLYRAYPMLIPSLYTYTYLASGWENEYLANFAGALLSVGCLPVAYWLGVLLKDERAGWLSALLLATAPTFGSWASAGYVDLPMAFFYGLAAVFSIRLWHSRRWQDALLAGIMMGLAAWTKNAALIGVLVLALWLLWSLIQRRIHLALMLLSLVTCGVVAAPWYVRNLAGAGFLMPDTAWIDQAARTLENLFAFITRSGNFGFTGWAVTAGLLSAAVFLVRHRANAPEYLLLLLWTLPFFAAWWLFVSYDPRFLLLFLPPLCALGGALLAAIWQRIPTSWRFPLQVGLALLALALTVQTLWLSVQYKDEFLRDPLMGDAEKRVIVGRE